MAAQILNSANEDQSLTAASDTANDPISPIEITRRMFLAAVHNTYGLFRNDFGFTEEGQLLIRMTAQNDLRVDNSSSYILLLIR